MVAFQVKIAFLGNDRAPQIELTAPASAHLEAQLAAVLEERDVVLSAFHVVRTDARLFARAKLLARDGSPLSHEQAAALIRSVRRHLSGPPHD